MRFSMILLVRVAPFLLLLGSKVEGQEWRAAEMPGIGSPNQRPILNMILPMLLKELPFMKYFNFSRPDVSEECADAFGFWIRSLSDPLKNWWALSMLDANAKVVPGILQGGLTMYGSFDECLGISVGPSDWPHLNGSKGYNNTIEGQYCLVNLVGNQGPSAQNISVPARDTRTDFLKTVAVASLRFDICLPSACSPEDINRAFSQILNTENVTVLPKVQRCESNKPVSLTASQIAAIVVYAVLGLFLFAGTILDIGIRLRTHYVKEGASESNKKSAWMQFLLSFSMYSNGLKLLNTNQSSDSLSVVNGIRFMSMTWVVLGHCYSFLTLGIAGNMLDVAELTKNFAMQGVFNGTLSVDSFFFLSGMLMAYVTIKELNKGIKLNKMFFFMFYFHRYWRLTPPLALTILFMFIWPLMGSGPMWSMFTDPLTNACTKHWWVDFLYIQNLIRPSDGTCLSHSWYLANDMQFYVISPLILVPLFMNRRIGLTVNGLILLASLITSGVISNVEHLIPTQLIAPDVPRSDTDRFTEMVYVKPWCRIGPFCIGIFVGYFLSLRRDYKIPRVWQVVCWCLAVVCNVSVLYATQPWNSGNMPSRGVSDFYLSVGRTIWALGLGWVTFACATGNGGIINRILSWEPFGPLGRMTYMAYLIHPFLQYMYIGALRERIIYTHYSFVTLFLGLLVISYGVAFGLSLAFEAPFVSLEKVLFRKPAVKEKKTAETINSSPTEHQENDTEVQSGIENPVYISMKTEL